MEVGAVRLSYFLKFLNYILNILHGISTQIYVVAAPKDFNFHEILQNLMKEIIISQTTGELLVSDRHFIFPKTDNFSIKNQP